MSATDEICRALQKYLDPRQLAEVMRLVEEAKREAGATGYAKGHAEGREAERGFHIATHRMTEPLMRGEA